MKETSDSKATELLAEAAAWRLASLLLERPRGEWKSDIKKLSSEVTHPRLLSCAKVSGHGTEENYHRLFGPGGTLSPREVSYCDFEDPGHLMAELSSFYDAFSFHPRREEPVDHISVETGFVGYLFLKEAFAEMRGDSESAEVTRNARTRFTQEHIARCARGMMGRRVNMHPYVRKVLSWLAEKGSSV